MISTDLHQLSINGPAYDLPTCMSKFLHLGMSLPEVVRATTSRPAELLGLDAGTLRPGSPADVALFRVLEGSFPLYDIWGEMREARRLVVNTLTVVGGRPLEPLPPQPPAPWAAAPDLAGAAEGVQRSPPGDARARPLAGRAAGRGGSCRDVAATGRGRAPRPASGRRRDRPRRR